MTDKEIEARSKEHADYKDKVASDSLAELAKTNMSEKVWEVGYLTEEIAERLHAVRTGKAPAQFGQFVEDMLARALSTEMFCRADGLYFDVKRAKESPSAKPVLQDCPLRVRTDAQVKWSQMASALCEYLRTAAALAKSVSQDPTAAHLYLKAWRIANDVATRCGGMDCATADEALAIVCLHRDACDRLWVDIEYSELPAFKPAKDLSPPAHKPHGYEVVGIIEE